MQQTEGRSHLPSIRGVILAAGLGSRLRPLTDRLPKPLIPFFDVPMFYLAAARFYGAGIEHIAANAHYHPTLLRKACRQNPFGEPIHCSYEPTLLGSGGLYGNLSDWSEGADLVAMNGDIVTSFSIAELVAKFSTKRQAFKQLELGRAREPVAALGLVKGRNLSGNSIWIDGASNLVVAIQPNEPEHTGPEVPTQLIPFMFSGIQILSKNFIGSLQANIYFDIIEKFREIISSGGEIYGFPQDVYWHDLGTPSGYLEAHRDFLDRFYAEARDLPDQHNSLEKTSCGQALDDSIISKVGLRDCIERLDKDVAFTCDDETFKGFQRGSAVSEANTSAVESPQGEASLRIAQGISIWKNSSASKQVGTKLQGANMVARSCSLRSSESVGPNAVLGGSLREAPKFTKNAIVFGSNFSDKAIKCGLKDAVLFDEVKVQAYEV